MSNENKIEIEKEIEIEIENEKKIEIEIEIKKEKEKEQEQYIEELEDKEDGSFQSSEGLLISGSEDLVEIEMERLLGSKKENLLKKKRKKKKQISIYMLFGFMSWVML
eukprot:Anaeramoba_flamelloidesa211_199.p2 GENE.a211_199~~a211_199.p2  ORF type:complete len:108 (+),score=55.11 a211_199:66-389(+)